MTATLQRQPAGAAGGPAAPSPDQSGVSGRARLLVRAARPHQWTKNALVFAAPALAGALGNGSTVLRAAVAFGAWSLVASAAYLLNDVRDAAADRIHPTKCLRPIASGALRPQAAIAAATVLGTAGLLLAASLGFVPLMLLVSYAALTAGYSLRLKRFPYLELGVVGAGFVLRVLTGAAATAAATSPALLGAVAAVAILATAGKRLGELRDLGRGAASHRAVLGRYRAATLTGVAAVAAAGAAIGYTSWVFTSAAGGLSAGWLASSAAFILLIDRYAMRATAGEAGDPFDVVRADRGLVLLAGSWLVATTLALIVG